MGTIGCLNECEGVELFGALPSQVKVVCLFQEEQNSTI